LRYTDALFVFAEVLRSLYGMTFLLLFVGSSSPQFVVVPSPPPSSLSELSFSPEMLVCVCSALRCLPIVVGEREGRLFGTRKLIPIVVGEREGRLFGMRKLI
jgi:hypothetical protein